MKASHAFCAVLLLSAAAQAEDGDKGIILDLNDSKITHAFQGNSQGWTFGSAAPVYTAATGGYHDGALNITGVDANTFGFWQSPEIEHYRSLFKETETAPEGEKLILFESYYRTRWTVASNAGDGADTPTFRFRASRWDNSETHELQINSQSARLAPDMNGREYIQFFNQADQNDRFHFAFDYINIGSADQGNTRLSLDHFSTEDVTQTAFGSPGTATTFDFSGSNTNGFTFSGIDGGGFASAIGTATANGLSIRGQNLIIVLPRATDKGAEPIRYGSWSRLTDITLEQGRLYRMDWRMSSSATNESSKAALPTFRLRANEQSLNMATLINIESISGSNRLPTSSTDQNYVSYFYVPEELDGQKLILSFDYIHIPGSGNSSFATLTLEEIRVQPYPIRL